METRVTDGPAAPRLISVGAARIAIQAKTGVNVSKSSIYRWIERGVIRSVRVAGRVLLYSADLERFLSQIKRDR